MTVEYIGKNTGMSYAETLEFQRTLFNRMVECKKSGKPIEEEVLLFADHEPVITLGRHAKVANLLLSEETLKGKGIEVYRIERGGDVTYHGPGQIVVYPLIDLEKHGLGVKDYVDLLEEAVIRTIAEFGIKGERIEGATGIWIGKGSSDERKICAIGIRCSRYISMHGLALNVNTDLSAFTLINPCGFIDKGVTSIAKEIGHEVDIKIVSDIFARHFENLLQR